MRMKKLLFGKTWGCKDNQWHTCWHQFYKLFNQQHTGLTVKEKYEENEALKLNIWAGEKETGTDSKGSSPWRWRVSEPRVPPTETQHILESLSPPQRTESAGK